MRKHSHCLNGLAMTAGAFAIAAQLPSCAPLRLQQADVTIVRSRLPAGERLDDPAGIGAVRLVLEGDEAIVTLRGTPLCRRSERDERRATVTKRWAPDQDVLLAEVAIAGLGAVLTGYALHDGRPSFGGGCGAFEGSACEKNSPATGIALLAGFPMLLAGGTAAVIDGVSARRETYRSSYCTYGPWQAGPCQSLVEAGRRLTLIIDSDRFDGSLGSKLVGRLRLSGKAIDSLRRGSAVEVLVEGQSLGRAVIDAQ